MTEKAIGILLAIGSAWWLTRSVRALRIEHRARRLVR